MGNNDQMAQNVAVAYIHQLSSRSTKKVLYEKKEAQME
jgi:hypothetical protein